MNLVVFANFANEITESLVHVDALLSRCLDESAPQVFGEVATLCDHNGQQNTVTSSAVIAEGTGEDCMLARVRTIHPDLTLVLQVALIGD